MPVVLLAALLFLGAGAGPVAAGGPTTLVVASAGDTAPAAVGSDNKAQQRLITLLGGYTSPGEGTTETGPGKHSLTSSVTVTWLFANIDVQRVDRILYTASGAPWIATQLGDMMYDPKKKRPAETGYRGPDPMLDAPVIWHRSPDGAALIRLLNRLRTNTDHEGPVTSRPTTYRPHPASSGPGPSELSGWWWIAGALVLGAGIGFGATRFRGTRPPSEPAQYLTDREL